MKLRSIKKRIVLHMVNHTLAGTRFFAGPIHNTGTLCIGANCWVGCNLTVSGNGTVTIGDNCDIAPDVTFLTGGHRIGSHARRAGEGETYRISVGNGVWIGAHATVLNNIGIGDGSVIAACACVRRDVPADTMVAGVPARVIKELEDLATDAQKE